MSNCLRVWATITINLEVGFQDPSRSTALYPSSEEYSTQQSLKPHPMSLGTFKRNNVRQTYSYEGESFKTKTILAVESQRAGHLPTAFCSQSVKVPLYSMSYTRETFSPQKCFCAQHYLTKTKTTIPTVCNES